MNTPTRTIACLFLLALSSRAVAQSAGQPTTAEPDDWPRVVVGDKASVVLHQPQIDRWDDFEEISARIAVSVQLDGTDTFELGSIRMTSTTTIDYETRSVLLGRRKIAGSMFPETDPDVHHEVMKAIEDALPNGRPLVMSLDEIVAYLDLGAHVMPEVEANLNPPPILWSQDPAVLAIFFGQPRFERVQETGHLLFAVNTNWDIFLDLPQARYYLLMGESWLTTTDLEAGPWTPAQSLPAALRALPDDPNWEEVRQRIPGSPASDAPRILVAYEPTELILTDGPPQFIPILGTHLLHVGNTKSDLFLFSDDGQFYLLTAGRWFRAKDLAGPWSAATTDLPTEFRKIPPDHELSRILASVPGTSEAKAAILLASVPRKATVNRSQATISVVYDGEPEFALIEYSEGVRYAVNSPHDVFSVADRYYCCYQGVWFIAPQAIGPWVVCTSVAPQIYTIPTTSPKYNVTYVTIVESSPETVVVSQTAGYQGQVVVAGLLMFGLGYAIAESDNIHVHSHYGAHYYSYGCAARYDYYHGGYYRSAHAYGPYGGAGRAASYNRSTGTYSRGAYRYGPRGGVAARDAYNPYTNRYAGQVRASTPYGSWGRTVVSDGNDWARAGHRSGPRGTVVGGENSDGGKVLAGRGRTGRGGVVGKTKDGDVYVGRNGNVYRRDDGGSWQGRQGNDWKTLDKATAEKRRTELNRQRQSRERGSARSREFNRSQSARRSRTGSGRSGRSGGAPRRGGRGR